MKVLIPMSGHGQRFIDAGYQDPKPLINVNGQKIIEYICEMFNKDDELIFICNELHIKENNIDKILKSIRPDAKVISIASHKKGPVHTIMEADMDNIIDGDEEVIVCYCDNPYLWNYEHFKSWVKEQDADGCILSHTDFHPHRLASTYMAYMKTTPPRRDGSIPHVLEVQEKKPFTNNHWEEQASTGTYYFKKGFYVKKYFQQAIDQNINYNGEHYVTLVYNLLIKDGLNVFCYPTDHVAVFGTPEEVQNFEAWQTILKGLQVKNENDLLKCYRYWKSYNAKRNSLKK